MQDNMWVKCKQLGRCTLESRIKEQAEILQQLQAPSISEVKPGQFDDNDPDQFRMYRILSEKERARLEVENKQLRKYSVFIDHIEKHLKEMKLDEPITCSVCDKTIEQIWVVEQALKEK